MAKTPPVPASSRAYLDAAVVAPLHPAARDAYHAALDEGWADPRRLHREGRRARQLLDGSRQAIAACLGARTQEITFTAGHTRAVHAAVTGVLAARHRIGRRVVASAVEHSAVLAAGSHSGELMTVGVDRSGRVDPDAFRTAVVDQPTALACLQVANAEVGTRQPVSQVADSCAAAGVPLLLDATAAAGHVEVPGTWDALVAGAGAWGGPAEVGVLALRAGTRWLSTEPEHDGVETVAGAPGVPAILAAAVALEAAVAAREMQAKRRFALVDAIRSAAAAVRATEVVGDPVDRLPHVVTFSCLYVDGEAVLDAFDRRGFAVGSGSACTASSLRPSHVLAAMGVLTHGNIRLGLPMTVRESEVDGFVAVLDDVVSQVRSQMGTADL